MKYIKYFEGVSLLRINRELESKELKDFCEEDLCYLVDDGFTIDVRPKDSEDQYDIFINKGNRSYYASGPYEKWSFDYEDICDYLIPFLTRLNKEYLFRDPYKNQFKRRVKEDFNNTIVISVIREDGRKLGSSYDIKDILSDDKSNEDIMELYNSKLVDIKVSVVPRKWNRHIDPKLVYYSKKQDSLR